MHVLTSIAPVALTIHINTLLNNGQGDYTLLGGLYIINDCILNRCTWQRVLYHNQHLRMVMMLRRFMPECEAAKYQKYRPFGVCGIQTTWHLLSSLVLCTYHRHPLDGIYLLRQTALKLISKITIADRAYTFSSTFTICIKIFVGCGICGMYICECPLSEDFRDLIFTVLFPADL